MILKMIDNGYLRDGLVFIIKVNDSEPVMQSKV